MDIKCNYRINNISLSTHCMLGYHGGNPTIEDCSACISNGKNVIENMTVVSSESRPLNILDLTENFSKALVGFTASGFSVTEPEELEFRLKTCKGCEFWDESGFVNTGRCAKCGCSTQAKLRMATEKCPVGKW